MNTQIAKRHRQGGVAVIIMLALLSIILIGTAAGLKALYRLDREIKLVDRQQVRRLEILSAANAAVRAVPLVATNAPAPISTTNNPAPPPIQK